MRVPQDRKQTERREPIGDTARREPAKQLAAQQNAIEEKRGENPPERYPHQAKSKEELSQVKRIGRSNPDLS